MLLRKHANTFVYKALKKLYDWQDQDFRAKKKNLHFLFSNKAVFDKTAKYNRYKLILCFEDVCTRHKYDRFSQDVRSFSRLSFTRLVFCPLGFFTARFFPYYFSPPFLSINDINQIKTNQAKTNQVNPNLNTTQSFLT